MSDCEIKRNYMTFYQYITENKVVVSTLYRCGVASGTIIRDYEIYSYYLDVLELGNTKSMAFSKSKEYFKISRKKMYLILERFTAQV